MTNPKEILATANQAEQAAIERFQTAVPGTSKKLVETIGRQAAVFVLSESISDADSMDPQVLDAVLNSSEPKTKP